MPFTNGPPLQFAMHEMQAALANPRIWAGLLVIAVVVALLGPFGTFTSLSLAGRLAYWGAVVIGTFWIGLAGTEVLRNLLPEARVGRIGAVVLTHLLVPIPIAGFVVAVALPFGMSPSLGDFAVLFLNCVALSMAITAVFALATPSAPATPVDGKPALLQRLPVAVRGDLVRLSAQGHYVEVVTTRGRSLLLLRLKDAIAETAPEPGLRIHRSHWVALRGVAATRRQNAQPHVVTQDGAPLPVSRGMVKAARAAGLI